MMDTVIFAKQNRPTENQTNGNKIEFRNFQNCMNKTDSGNIEKNQTYTTNTGRHKGYPPRDSQGTHYGRNKTDSKVIYRNLSEINLYNTVSDELK